MPAWYLRENFDIVTPVTTSSATSTNTKRHNDVRATMCFPEIFKRNQYTSGEVTLSNSFCLTFEKVST